MRWTTLAHAGLMLAACSTDDTDDHTGTSSDELSVIAESNCQAFADCTGADSAWVEDCARDADLQITAAEYRHMAPSTLAMFAQRPSTTQLDRGREPENSGGIHCDEGPRGEAQKVVTYSSGDERDGAHRSVGRGPRVAPGSAGRLPYRRQREGGGRF
jgi:hypothetical protein